MDTMWAGGNSTFDENGGLGNGALGGMSDMDLMFYLDDNHTWEQREQFTAQFQGMTEDQLRAALAGKLDLAPQQIGPGSYLVSGGDDDNIGRAVNPGDPDYQYRWEDPNNPDIRYATRIDPNTGTVQDVSRRSQASDARSSRNAALIGGAIVGGAALAAGGGTAGAAGATAAEGGALGGGAAATGTVGTTAAAGGAAAAIDPLYGGAVGSGATAGTGAGATAAVGGGSLWDQVANYFTSGNTDWNSLLGTAGSIWGASQAEDANDAILANSQASGQRLTERLDGMQDGMFTPYSYSVGGRTATADANGTNIGADPRTAAVQAAQMQAIQQSQRDPNQLANTMFGNYRAGVQDYESGQFDALQQKLERQGLAGLSNARSGGNPHYSAFSRGVADSNAANYNNFFQQAENSNMNAANRANVFAGMDNTMFNQGATLAQSAATGNQQNFNNQTTLFDQYAGIEEMQLNASNSAIAGDLARQQSLVQNLFGLGGANRGN